MKHYGLAADTRRVACLAAAFLMVLALVAGVAEGQEAADTELLAVAKGRVTYRIYCTSCHGAKGVGDGKLAGFLVPKPANLTVLSSNNGGEFPAEQVRMIIDGREKVPGHGGGDMPAWGDVFKGLEEGNEDAEGAVAARIDQLVSFLRSIQEGEG